MIYHPVKYYGPIWDDIFLMVKEHYGADYNDDYVLVVAAHMNTHISVYRELHPGKKLVVYQLETLSDNHWFPKEYIIDILKGYDEVWEHDLDNLDILREHGIDAKYKPFLYTPALTRIVNEDDPPIDILFYGNLDGTRADTIKTISMLDGLDIELQKKIVYLKNVTGKELDEYIAKSKVVLSLGHCGITDLQNQSRIYYLLSNGKCVLNEKSRRNYFGDAIAEFHDATELQVKLRELLVDEQWKTYAKHSIEKYKAISKEMKMNMIENTMKNKKAKIVMITMFKNEAKVIRRMLESCYKHIDFWVIQNNGSTDGTDQIVKDFFDEHKVPGVLYDVEEGWVGFGWNRDHLIRTCQSIDHGCDWILKMDCDEILEVDDDFDWSPLDNHDIDSFHVTAVSANIIYHRCWLWNAKLKWGFNHDPCHETVYKINEDGSQTEEFARINLPVGFRQIGFNEGQSWSNPTKFISDSLKLEEKLISEGVMLENLYHFWYVGKSYYDAFGGGGFPLGRGQQVEYARRCIYYFEEYVNYINSTRPGALDELSYLALVYCGNAAAFMEEPEKAVVYYTRAGRMIPERNDHLFEMAQLYMHLGKYNEMHEVTSIMMQPERTNPFPRYVCFIDTSMYHDSATQRVQGLHQFASERTQSQDFSRKDVMFNFAPVQRKRLFIVDNFYQDPDAVRDFALSVEFKPDIRWYKGLRTTSVYRPVGIKEAFEKIIGEKITRWDEHCYNGVFQLCTAEDPQVYHYDSQQWAAMIYLTPNAPIESGTRLHRSRINGVFDSRQIGVDDAFEGNFYDSTRFDITDRAANLYNRLIIMDARCIHSAGPYFGKNMQDARLTHLFFFD